MSNAKDVAQRLIAEQSKGPIAAAKKAAWISEASTTMQRLLDALESVKPQESVTYTFLNQDFCGNKHYMKIRDGKILSLTSFTGARLSLSNITHDVPALELAIEKQVTTSGMRSVLDRMAQGKTKWELKSA